MSASHLKVLVSGAGVAGPALAVWLARLGCDVTIIEREQSLRAGGQQVDFRAQGVPVMRKMGIEPAVLEKICKEPGMRMIDRHGDTIAYFPANNTGTGKQGATSEYEIMRGDLVQILYDATKDLEGVRYLFGVSIESFTQDEGSSAGRVHVKFSDGRTDDYDLLVGADGVGSSTRKLMLGPSFPDPRHDLGVHIAFYTIPSSDDDPRDWRISFQLGGRVIGSRKDRPDVLRIYMSIQNDCEALDEAARSGDLEAQKRAWAESFKNVEWSEARRFVKELLESKEADDMYTQHINQIRLPEGMWSKGGVVLLGDAAYCPTPYAGGLGTTAALVGAYVLAGEIARQCQSTPEPLGQDEGPMVRAAQSYERIMRPFITKIQPVNPLVLRALHPKWQWEIWVYRVLAWLLSLFSLDWFIGSSEEVGGFKLPDYPELDARV